MGFFVLKVGKEHRRERDLRDFLFVLKVDEEHRRSRDLWDFVVFLIFSPPPSPHLIFFIKKREDFNETIICLRSVTIWLVTQVHFRTDKQCSAKPQHVLEHAQWNVCNLPEVGGNASDGLLAERRHSCISLVPVVVKTSHFTATRWVEKTVAVQ